MLVATNSYLRQYKIHIYQSQINKEIKRWTERLNPIKYLHYQVSTYIK